MGVLIRRTLLFGVYIRAPDFWKLPHSNEYDRNLTTWAPEFQLHALLVGGAH